MIAEVTSPVTTADGVGGPDWSMTRFNVILDGNRVRVMYPSGRREDGTQHDFQQGDRVDIRGILQKDRYGNRVLMATGCWKAPEEEQQE